MAQAAPKLQTILSFRHVLGANPDGGLVSDGAGNLYGTTIAGGDADRGVVFELSPPAQGASAWTKTVLYSFKSGSNGRTPIAGLILDGAGALYGSTSTGAGHHAGGVFALAPPAEGQTAWAIKTLHAFNGADGATPVGAVTFGGDGALYGTTDEGGPANLGVAYKLSPPAGKKGRWSQTVLHAFDGNDGAAPGAALLPDGAGGFYGTATNGGTGVGNGVVFQLSPPQSGQSAWKVKVLHYFAGGADGAAPCGALIADAKGDLYGTTQVGGAFGDGVVFRLHTPSRGARAWTETVLISFDGAGGRIPQSALVADKAGNFYGTTSRGGAYDSGVAFELHPPAQGGQDWTETVLHSFGSTGRDGVFSSATLILDTSGNLYGTTFEGGAHGVGTVFKLTP